MRNVMVVLVFALGVLSLGCNRMKLDKPDQGPAQQPAAVEAKIKPETMHIETDHVRITVVADRGLECIQETCIQVAASKYGPGFTLPHEGSALVELGTDAIVIVEFEGTDVTGLYFFDADQRKDLKPETKFAVQMGAFKSPAQVNVFDWRYIISWQRK
jgi:hypothetical protein